jgi:hypothetical protein
VALPAPSGPVEWFVNTYRPVVLRRRNRGVLLAAAGLAILAAAVIVPDLYDTALHGADVPLYAGGYVAGVIVAGFGLAYAYPSRQSYTWPAACPTRVGLAEDGVRVEYDPRSRFARQNDPVLPQYIPWTRVHEVKSDHEARWSSPARRILFFSPLERPSEIRQISAELAERIVLEARARAPVGTEVVDGSRRA